MLGRIEPLPFLPIANFFFFQSRRCCPQTPPCFCCGRKIFLSAPPVRTFFHREDIPFSLLTLFQRPSLSPCGLKRQFGDPLSSTCVFFSCSVISFPSDQTSRPPLDQSSFISCDFPTRGQSPFQEPPRQMNVAAIPRSLPPPPFPGRFTSPPMMQISIFPPFCLPI